MTTKNNALFELAPLIDTHCHINILVKKNFDTKLTHDDYKKAEYIIAQAREKQISKIINVGTSYLESMNSIYLAERFSEVYATIGIHPNDLTDTWQAELKELELLITDQKNKIVGIGETGLDTHYPDYNLPQQQDAFRAHIELALKYNLALVVHTRDAPEETLRILEEFKDSNLRGTIHCFSNDLFFAQEVIAMGFVIGLGGTITYPKNNILRTVAQNSALEHIILETDAPYLPIQKMRGKTNHPAYIYDIALYLAELRNQPFEIIAQTTTQNALKLFKL